MNDLVVLRSIRKVEDVLPDITATLSPLRLARREKILDVAELLFADQGFRATTMESVAAKAGVSKVTLYGYFHDKDVLFGAVANRVAERLLDAVRTALRQPGEIEFIVADALKRKHQIVWDLVRGSAFSTELFAAKTEFASAKFADLDARIEAEIARALQERKVTAAKATARLLFGAATGIANRAASKKQLGKDISAVVKALLQRPRESQK